MSSLTVVDDKKHSGKKEKVEKRDFSSMDVAALCKELVELHRALCSARLQRSMGQLKDTSQFRKVRREIARVNGVLSSKMRVE